MGKAKTPEPATIDTMSELERQRQAARIRKEVAARRLSLDRLDHDSALALAELEKQAEELEQHGQRERRRLAEQERLHGWLHGWLLLHIPLSAALLVLGVAHAVTALYY